MCEYMRVCIRLAWSLWTAPEAGVLPSCITFSTHSQFVILDAVRWFAVILRRADDAEVHQHGEFAMLVLRKPLQRQGE